MHQVCCVGRNVAGLVIGVQDEVHAGHVFISFTLADHVSEVGTHVQFRIDGDLLVAPELQVVDEGGDDWDTGNDVTGILVDRFPGGHLVELAGIVETGELGIFLHSKNTDREHHHRMAVPWQGFDRVEHVLGNYLARFPLGNDFVHLSLGRNIADQKEIPERFDSRILGAGSLGQGLKGLGDGLAAEADPFLRVQVGDIGNETADVTGAADTLVDVDLVDDNLAEFLDEPGGTGTVCLNLLLKRFLECHGVCSPFVCWDD